MKKITVMGANAARQKTLRFEQFQPGGINRAAAMSEISAGKGINFCRAVKTWGVCSAEVVQFAGGENGNYLVAALEKENIPALTVRCQAPLRCCVTCIDNSTRTTTEIIEPSGAASADECAEYLKLFAASLVDASGAAICGTLPDGTDPALYLRAGRLAAEHSLPLLLDLYKNAEELFEVENSMLKINRDELGKLTSCGDVAAGISALFSRYPFAAIAITDGPGQAFASDGNILAVYDIPALDEVVNPIGCGDTASAVFLSEFINGTPVIPAFQLALGAASANAETWNPAQFNAGRGRELAAEIHVETVALK